MKIIILLICIVSYASVFAQNLGDKLLDNTKRTLERRLENAVDRNVNKGVDKVEQGTNNTIKGNKKDKKEKNDKKSNSTEVETNSNNVETSNSDKNSTANKSSSLSVYSKFDFVQGDKIIASEDFSQDAIGDFPAKWNTNGSGEVVNLNNNYAVKYLKTSGECVFYPEWINSFPDNFTVEFDLYTTDTYSFYSGDFIIGFTSEKNIGNNFRRFDIYGYGKIDKGGGFEITFHPQNAGCSGGVSRVRNVLNGQEILSNEAAQEQFTVCKNKKTNVHVSIWRQKGRVRVYLDEKKVWDLPKLCPDGVNLSSIYFRNDGGKPEEEAYFLSNLRVAVGAPDTRNKLITEGKFSTTGIKFDSGSDKIKPESYGILKEIAMVLNENPDVKIKIVGHTDTDGTPDKNLELSKKRALSVKNALINEFGIDSSRMQADGKGQNEPVDNNSTPQGKANNRRVEFIKL